MDIIVVNSQFPVRVYKKNKRSNVTSDKNWMIKQKKHDVHWSTKWKIKNSDERHIHMLQFIDMEILCVNSEHCNKFWCYSACFIQ